MSMLAFSAVMFILMIMFEFFGLLTTFRFKVNRVKRIGYPVIEFAGITLTHVILEEVS